MASELEKDLNRIFFGKMPKFFRLLIKHEESKTNEENPFDKQNKTIENLNHVTYLHDSYDAMSDEMKEYLHNLDKKENEQEKLELIEANRLYFNTVYLLDIQDVDLDIEFKYNLTVFFLNYIMTGTRIFNGWVMNNQDIFIEMLLKNEKYYHSEIKRIMNEQRDALKKEIAKLEEQDIGKSEQKANQEIHTDGVIKETKPTPKTAIPDKKFIRVLTDMQQGKLISFLAAGEYLNHPKEFVSFLIGEHDSSGIEITGEKNELAICYLIYLLRQNKYLKLNYDSNYHEYLEQYFCPFTILGVKGQVKSNIRKVQRNSKLKKTIGKPLEAFIDTLSAKSK